MIKKKIWILLALICYSISSLFYCSFAFADSGGGGTSFDPETAEDLGTIGELVEDIADAIETGKLSPDFYLPAFEGAVAGAFATLAGASSPVSYGLVVSGIGAVVENCLDGINSVKDGNGNFGYEIQPSAADTMYNEAVKIIAQNSGFSSVPIVLPRGIFAETGIPSNIQYDTDMHFGDYSVVAGIGRDASYPVGWSCTQYLPSTDYVWNQNVVLSGGGWVNGYVGLFSYDSLENSNGWVPYPSDGATANNYTVINRFYYPYISGNSFIAFTTYDDVFDPVARLETMIRNPWLDNKIITHDTIMNTNWEEINTTNYTILQQGVNDGMDVAALLAALNAQTDVMNDLLLQLNETLDTLQELLQYAILIYDKLDKWFPDYDEADLPPVTDISNLAEDYTVPDKNFSSDFWDEIWDNSYIWILVSPLFVAITGYALFGRG